MFAQTEEEEKTCQAVTKKNAMDFQRTGDLIHLLWLYEGAMTK